MEYAKELRNGEVKIKISGSQIVDVDIIEI
jgi:hypothetical protein